IRRARTRLVAWTGPGRPEATRVGAGAPLQHRPVGNRRPVRSTRTSVTETPGELRQDRPPYPPTAPRGWPGRPPAAAATRRAAAAAPAPPPPRAPGPPPAPPSH